MVKVSRVSARSRREKGRSERKKETVKTKLLDESDSKLAETVEVSTTAYAFISQQDVDYNVEPPNKVAKQMYDSSVSNGDYKQSHYDAASDTEYLPSCKATETRYKTDSVYKETKKKKYVENTMAMNSTENRLRRDLLRHLPSDIPLMNSTRLLHRKRLE